MKKTNTKGKAASLALGHAVLARFRSVAVPGGLKPFINSFARAHEAFAEGARAVAASKKEYDAALTAVADADARLDEHVETLATRLVAASLGTRGAPFASFASKSPSEIRREAYANEVADVRALVDAVLAVKPPAEVVKEAKGCARAADSVAASLDTLTKPQLAYTHALAARDTSHVAWSRALQRLKTQAGAALMEDDMDVRSFFTPPTSLQAPPRRRPKPATLADGQPGTDRATGTKVSAEE